MHCTHKCLIMYRRPWIYIESLIIKAFFWRNVWLIVNDLISRFKSHQWVITIAEKWPFRSLYVVYFNQNTFMYISSSRKGQLKVELEGKWPNKCLFTFLMLCLVKSYLPSKTLLPFCTAFSRIYRPNVQQINRVQNPAFESLSPLLTVAVGAEALAEFALLTLSEQVKQDSI